ncbi:hypothetical protein B484DRAFT_457501 [Ochromonadaceae sp. CCMP2298]|nr:hypothetical protein B484DRAFT_457501 [Ochromonadaceae sp. CCMP2298]
MLGAGMRLAGSLMRERVGAVLGQQGVQGQQGMGMQDAAQGQETAAQGQGAASQVWADLALLQEQVAAAVLLLVGVPLVRSVQARKAEAEVETEVEAEVELEAEAEMKVEVEAEAEVVAEVEVEATVHGVETQAAGSSEVDEGMPPTHTHDLVRRSLMAADGVAGLLGGLESFCARLAHLSELFNQDGVGVGVDKGAEGAGAEYGAGAGAVVGAGEGALGPLLCSLAHRGSYTATTEIEARALYVLSQRLRSHTDRTHEWHSRDGREIGPPTSKQFTCRLRETTPFSTPPTPRTSLYPTPFSPTAPTATAPFSTAPTSTAPSSPSFEGDVFHMQAGVEGDCLRLSFRVLEGD